MITKYVPQDLNPISVVSIAQRCHTVFARQDQKPRLDSDQPHQIKDNDTVYCWTNLVPQLFNYLRTKNIKNITLITGDNDHPSNPNGICVGWPQAMKDNLHCMPPSPPSVTSWHSQNAEIVNSIMKPLPIGVCKFYYTNGSWDGKKHAADYTRDKLLYSNFTIANNVVQRLCVDSIIKESCPNHTKVSQPVDFGQYCRDLQEHKFVLCPPGNGKDTHRAWESLHMGSVPIVEDSMMNRYYSQFFPMVVVESWWDVTEDFLNRKYEELNSKTWRMELLDIDNWMKEHGIRTANPLKNIIW
jgi:hypothetical protein